jgi:hypothetical protein
VISEGLRRLFDAHVHTMPIWESQFLLKQVYGIDSFGLVDYDNFTIPAAGPFDLVICNRRSTSTRSCGVSRPTGSTWCSTGGGNSITCRWHVEVRSRWDVRARFADEWPGIVERAVAEGLVEFDADGVLRLVSRETTRKDMETLR